MRRLAKAESAFTSGRSAHGAGRDALALATRGASLDADGSGAPAFGRVRALGAVLALATLALLVLASPAPAATIGGSGIQEYWGNPRSNSVLEGGGFHTEGPRGVAANEASGDVYVADTGHHRIQQFNEDGDFIRAWGWDVVQGSPVAFEVCTVAITCKAGDPTASQAGGAMNRPAGIAINQSSGHIYVVDVGNNATTGNRVQEFRIDDNGTPANPADDFAVFVRAFGQDVIVNTGTPANSNGTGYEVCDTTTVPPNTAAECKAGTSTGVAGGSFNMPLPGNNIRHADLTIAPDGAPNAGNVLVTDPARARVQEFTAEGAFVRAFGFDVVEPGGSGSADVNEEQAITLNPSLADGSTFTLSFGAVAPTTTTPIDVDAEASEVEAALAALGSIGGAANVEVSGAGGGPWTVEFTGALGDRDQAQIAIALSAAGAGTQLGCNGTPANANRAFQWLADGAPATGTGAAADTYTVDEDDAGKALQCRVTATTATGTPPTGPSGAVQVSNPAIGGAPLAGALPVAPATITAPAAPVGGFSAGNKLICAPGTWTGATPPLAFQWYRNGVALVGNGAGTGEYTMQAADLATAANFQCAVTGSNANGLVVKVSANRVTAAPAPVPSPAAPAAGSTISTAAGTVVTAQQGALAFEVCTVAAQCKAGISAAAAGNVVGQFAANAVRSVAEDPGGNIYTVEAADGAAVGASNFRVQRFILSDPGNAIEPQGTFACDVLCGTNSAGATRNQPQHVAVDGAGYVYVTKSFPQETGNPLVEIFDIQQNNYQQRVLKVDPDTGQVVHTFLANPGAFNKYEPGAVYPPHGNFGLTGLAVRQTGSPLYVVNTPASGQSASTSRVFRVGEIEGFTATVSATGVAAVSATLEATITLADIPRPTSYYFEYSRAGVDEWSQFRAPEETDQRVSGVNIGNGSDGGVSSSCSPEDQAATCHVSQVIDGLARNEVYEYRLVVRTEANGLHYISDQETFETQPASPSAVTGPAVWSGPPSTEPSLTFTGQVNPQGAQTRFSFQYGAEGPCSANSCKQVPLAPRDIGHGVVMLDVNATVAGLDPAHVYHYRIVADNGEPGSPSFGADQVVDPPSSSDRFIELVTDGDSQGGGIVPNRRLLVSDDGERALFSALAFGDQGSAPSITNPMISSRGESGWAVTSMVPELGHSLASPEVATSLRVDAQLTKVLWVEKPAPGAYRWMSKSLDGGYDPVSPLLSPLERVGGQQDRFLFRGASLDHSKIVFANDSSDGGKTFLPDESLVLGGGNPKYSNLYAINDAGGANPALSVVNRGADGKVIGAGCGARLGGEENSAFANAETTRAVSTDGSAIYFSARPTAPVGACVTSGNPMRLFKRVNDATTVEVSACAKTPPATCAASGDDYFSGASADGARVFFTSPRQLTDSDTDTGAACVDNASPITATTSAGCDLYLYDSSPPAGQPNLVQVSAGEAVAGDHPVPGSGARVLGVLDVSMDGSRVYFVARGRLTAAAAEEANNLYVYQRDVGVPGGRIEFVATLSARTSTETDRADTGLWARRTGTVGKAAYALPYYDGLGAGRAAGDGHLFVFTSEAKLLPEDEDSVNDLYRYDDAAAGNKLSCLTCAKDGNLPVELYDRNGLLTSTAGIVQEQRVASEDGSSIVFMSRERLLEEDTNDVTDIYLWREGEGLSLISAATGRIGVLGRDIGDSGRGPAISPDGQSVFFLTRATILPQDVNNGAPDLYVARVGGGFPQEEGASDPCEALGDACQGEDPMPNPAPSPASSALFSGPGNFRGKEGAPRLCGKAKVRRGGRCISKQALARRACAKRKGKAKRRCIRNQTRRLSKIQQRQNRTNANRGAGR